MNARMLHACAVLALLCCLLPRASALTLLADNRSMSVNGTFQGQPINSVATPSTPFGTFGSLVAGGFSMSQTSSFSANSISSLGGLGVLFDQGPGQSANDTGTNTFAVTFHVDSQVDYTYTAHLGLGLIGTLSFSGPGFGGNAMFVPGGLPLSLSGTLAPGDYALSFVASATLISPSGLPYQPIGSTTSYDFQFNTRVPDYGPGLLFLVALSFVFHRLRNLSFPGV